MKRIKNILISLFLCIFLFPSTGCGNNHTNIVERFEITRVGVNWDSDDHIFVEGKIIFKSDVELSPFYYLLYIGNEDLEKYNCNSYIDLLKNDEFIDFARITLTHLIPAQTDYLKQKDFIFATYREEAILLYETNDNTTDLQNYVGVIKVTEKDIADFKNGG